MATTIAEAQVSAAERDDAALAREAAGEPGGEAFALLYQRHRESSFRFLLGLVGERALAEDALQDAWFNVYRGLERYDPRRPFRPWLLQVARNAGLNALRARRKAPLADTDPERRAISDRVLQAAARAEASEVAEEALVALPAETRALLIERFGLELKQAELAASYACSERTIRNRLGAALDALTQALVAARGPHSEESSS